MCFNFFSSVGAFVIAATSAWLVMADSINSFPVLFPFSYLNAFFAYLLTFFVTTMEPTDIIQSVKMRGIRIRGFAVFVWYAFGKCVKNI